MAVVAVVVVIGIAWIAISSLQPYTALTQIPPALTLEPWRAEGENPGTDAESARIVTECAPRRPPSRRPESAMPIAGPN